MTAAKKSPASVSTNGSYKSSSSTLSNQFNSDKIRKFVAELEVPFNSSLIEWRVVNVTEDGSRGQILPYADQRAYTDRLNELFTPAGWTRKYTVNTSANFQRSEDSKVVAKVFVTCDLTIHGIGSHSATGEEWTDNDNAGTSAEAQAFKRAYSCFGLGRYLYDISKTWVDLDEHHRPQETPQIVGWATPAGWRSGLRPHNGHDVKPAEPRIVGTLKTGTSARSHTSISPAAKELIQQIEAMAEPLRKPMYRGILKTVAKVWSPNIIRDTVVLEEVLTSMQSAAQYMRRLEGAQERTGPELLKRTLNSFKVKSLEKLDDLGTLQRLVQALEEQADAVGS
jgi:hypothetical protein